MRSKSLLKVHTVCTQESATVANSKVDTRQNLKNTHTFIREQATTPVLRRLVCCYLFAFTTLKKRQNDNTFFETFRDETGAES